MSGAFIFILECFACRKMSSTYGHRLHVDGEIISQVRNPNLKDAETQTKISITL